MNDSVACPPGLAGATLKTGWLVLSPRLFAVALFMKKVKALGIP